MRGGRQLDSPRAHNVPGPALSQLIWTPPPERHRPLFKQVLKHIGVQSLGLTPAGLRGGGATDFWLRTRDVPALRRRGRWSNEKTLERHLQEGAYFLCTTCIPADTSALLDALVEYAARPAGQCASPTTHPNIHFSSARLRWHGQAAVSQDSFRAQWLALSSPAAATLTPCVGQKETGTVDDQDRGDTHFHF